MKYPRPSDFINKRGFIQLTTLTGKGMALALAWLCTKPKIKEAREGPDFFCLSLMRVQCQQNYIHFSGSMYNSEMVQHCQESML